MRNKFSVVTAERRALIAGDEGRRVQTRVPVRTHLVDRHADEGLYPSEVETAVGLAVLRVEVPGVLAAPPLNYVSHDRPFTPGSRQRTADTADLGETLFSG
ncbi:unannotated protein [freshwater metagenome]|uniref:Unannotated protein n=1 Tax=freshwater metagenome TaxID=449393 RepID=A0A6J6RRA5_9ZZZZ